MNEMNIPQISTGDILRKAIKNETRTGIEAKRYIDAGQLVPDEVVIAIVKERLQEADCENGYILDGFPRTVPQAEALSTFARIDAALNLSVPDEMIIKRLSGRRVCPACGGTYHVSALNGSDKCEACGEKLIQRKDDQPETIQARLKVYGEQTAPLVEYYEAKGLLRTVQGTGTVDENHAAVRKALNIQ